MRHFSTGKARSEAGTGNKTEHVQRSSASSFTLGNRATAGLFQESIGPSGDAFEQEADRAAQAVVNGRTGTHLTTGAVGIQRKCAACEQEEEEKIRRQPKSDASEEASMEEVPQEPAEAAAVERAAAQERPETAPSSLIVEDDAEAVPGQMRKEEFLAELRSAVCATADEAMAGTGRDTKGCPFVDYWIGYYQGESANHVERALQRYAPEAAGAQSAREYIAIAAARVRRSVDIWAKTGEITGVPADVPGMGALGVLGAAGGMFFKARPGGPRNANPASVRDQLGGGRPLSGAVRSRMESAFGASFSGVRLHTDSKASQLSDQLNARAFTVGQHVAFGAGEYKPGSMAGDALIAHELAHVVQQGGAAESAPMAKSPTSTGPIEQDADRAAVGAVAALWGGVKGALGNAGPALKSGLQLSRCPKGGSTESLEVHMRPILVAEDDGTKSTTSPSFAAAKRIWSKCCIDVTEDAGTTVKKSAYKELEDGGSGAPLTAEETSLFTDAGGSSGVVQLAIVDTIRRGSNAGKNVAGGATTKDSGMASAKIIAVDGTDPTVIAHELGHAMGYAKHGPAGTVMQPSGAHDKPVDEKVTAAQCSTVRAYTSATKTGKAECSLDTT